MGKTLTSHTFDELIWAYKKIFGGFKGSREAVITKCDVHGYICTYIEQ